MKEELSKKILNKNFTHQSIGYDAREVDSFLDDINVEVEKLEKEIVKLNEELNRLRTNIKANESKISNLNMENNSLRANTTTNNNTFNGNSNLELIKRLSNLENMVQQLLNKN